MSNFCYKIDWISNFKIKSEKLKIANFKIKSEKLKKIFFKQKINRKNSFIANVLLFALQVFDCGSDFYTPTKWKGSRKHYELVQDAIIRKNCNKAAKQATQNEEHAGRVGSKPASAKETTTSTTGTTADESKQDKAEKAAAAAQKPEGAEKVVKQSGWLIDSTKSLLQHGQRLPPRPPPIQHWSLI